MLYSNATKVVFTSYPKDGSYETQIGWTYKEVLGNGTTATLTGTFYSPPFWQWSKATDDYGFFWDQVS